MCSGCAQPLESRKLCSCVHEAHVLRKVRAFAAWCLEEIEELTVHESTQKPGPSRGNRKVHVQARAIPSPRHVGLMAGRHSPAPAELRVDFWANMLYVWGRVLKVRVRSCVILIFLPTFLPPSSSPGYW